MRYDKTAMLFLTTLLLLINLAGCAFSNDQEEIDVENSIEKEDENKEMVIGYADYPAYTSIEDIREQSELIIHGKVLSKKCSWMSLIIPDYKDDGYIDPEGDKESEPELVTIYEVSVIDEYKKTESNKTIVNVMMLGGETPEVIYKIDDTPVMAEGEEYVFFLTGSSILENGFWLLNDTQSLYLVEGDIISKTNDAGFELSFDKLEEFKIE